MVAILNAVAALVGALVLMYIVASVIRVLGGNSIATFVAQTIVNSAYGVGLLYFSIITVPTLTVIAGLALIVRIVAVAWFYYLGRKVLNGAYGQESMWAAELVEAGDEKFIEASEELSDIEVQEAGIIADSKEELREAVIERAEDD